MRVPAALRESVLLRDNYRCAYCLTSQENSGQRLQIDHIIPRAHGGMTTLDNLCACCASCNSHKAARLFGLDPASDNAVQLFHPGQQAWRDHFAWDENGTLIIGLSTVGRATIAALEMNNDTIVWARRRWVEAGWHPPS